MFFCRLGDGAKGDVFDFFHALLTVADEGNVVAADFDHLGQFNLRDNRGRQRVNTFNADAIGDFADGHGFADAIAANLHNQAFKDLDTFAFLAFGVEIFDFLVNTDGHARFYLPRLDSGWEL